LDQDGDGELDITPYDIRTTRMVRRWFKKLDHILTQLLRMKTLT
jgi:hypothetical protein